MKGISAGEVEKHFADHCVFNYGPSWPQNRQLEAVNVVFFVEVCRSLTMHNEFTTRIIRKQMARSSDLIARYYQLCARKQQITIATGTYILRL